MQISTKYDTNWASSDQWKLSSGNVSTCSSQPHHRGKHGSTCWMEKSAFNPPAHTHTHLNSAVNSSTSACVSFRVRSYFLGYLDHLLCPNLGLSSPAGGLFRRVPLGPSSLRLSRLHGSAPKTSCTAAERCERPLCCRGFPPVCWDLEAAHRGQSGPASSRLFLQQRF